MAVADRHADALRRNGRRRGFYDHAVLQAAPDAQRLLLAFFFLAADVGDHIVNHFRPVFKGLARPGNRLIGRRHHRLRPEFPQRMQRRRIALDGAVRLHRNKAPLRAQALFLIWDHLGVLRVQFRDHHRHVRRPAVGAVVGDNGRFRLRISLLDRPDLLFSHIDGAEYKIDLGRHLLHGVYILYHDRFHTLRHRRIQLPAAARRLLIRLSHAAGAGRDHGYLVPRMIL